ncbi:MAG: hypothetical protein QM492_00465 [Rhodobacterales bacterium]
MNIANKNLLQQGVKTLETLNDGPAGRPDLVLVTGAPRTGTSLAQMVLCSANNVNPYISEATPLYSLVKSTSEILSHYKRFPKDYFNSETNMQAVLAQEYDLFFDACKHRYNVGTLVFKSPAMAPFLPTLFQTARQHICTLVMVRDPFQTLSSLLRWRDKAATAGKPTIYSGVPLQLLAKHIVRHYGFVTDLVLPASKHVKFCKFETLLNHTDETRQDWENWSGLQGMDYAGNKDMETKDAAFSHTKYFGAKISKGPLSHALHPDVLANKDELSSIFYYYCEAFGYENEAGETGSFMPTDSLNRILNQDLKVTSAVGKSTTKMVKIGKETKSLMLQKAGAVKQAHVDRYAKLMERYKAQAAQNKETRKVQQSTIAALKASISREKKKQVKQQEKYAGLNDRLKAQTEQIKEARKLAETNKATAQKFAKKLTDLKAKFKEQTEFFQELRKQVEFHKKTAQKFARKYADLLLRMEWQDKEKQVPTESNDHDKA